MPKNKRIQPDDVSGRLFRTALSDAYAVLDSNSCRLARALGMKSRTCQAWLDGQEWPPYRKMQQYYYLLLDVVEKAPRHK